MKNPLRIALCGLLLSAGLTACNSSDQPIQADAPAPVNPADSLATVQASADTLGNELSASPTPVATGSHRAYHDAHYYGFARRHLYYSDPFSLYNNRGSRAYHRPFEEEHAAEEHHSSVGSHVATAAAAGAAGLAAGYYLTKKTSRPAPVATPAPRYSATPAPFRKAPSPVFTVPSRPAVSRPAAPASHVSESHSSASSSSSSAGRRTFTLSGSSRSRSFGRRR